MKCSQICPIHQVHIEEFVPFFIHRADLRFQHPHKVLRRLKIVPRCGQECSDQAEESIDIFVRMPHGQVMMPRFLKVFGEEEA